MRLQDISAILNKVDHDISESLSICDAIREAANQVSLTPALLAVAKTLADTEWALCGGLAVGVLTQPRGTKDIDVLLLDRSTAISKLLDSHLFRVEGNRLLFNDGGVIDILDINNLDMPKAVAKQALKTATPQVVAGCRLPVVSPAALIAMKLGRATAGTIGSYQDKHDIILLLIKHGYQDLSGFNLSSDMFKEYEQLVLQAKSG